MTLVQQHIPEDDLALFALALQPPDEAAEIRAHLQQCDTCRSEVARLQGDLVVFAFSAVTLEDAPPVARTRFLEAVARDKRPHTPTLISEPTAPALLSNRPQETPRIPPVLAMPARRGMGLAGWAGWAVAAGVTAFAGWQFHAQQSLRDQLSAQLSNTQQITARTAHAERIVQVLTDPSAMQVALHLPTPGSAPPKPEAHASYNESKGELVFIAAHLAPLQPAKTYELWLLPASGTAPVPAGLFKPDRNGNASVILPRLPENTAAKGFGVTVEHDGGSSSPTLPIVLAGL